MPDNIPMLSYKKVQDKVIITDVMPVIGEDDKYKFITVPKTIDSVKPEFPENVQEIIKDSPHVHRGSDIVTCMGKFCEICGMAYGETDPENHSFKHYISNNNATCTEDGTETATCDWCHTATDEQEIAGTAKGHSGGEATCTHRAICEECDAEYGELNPENHSFKHYISNNNATCTEDGTETATCDWCHTAIDEREEANSAKGHSANTEWKNDENVHWHICIDCGDKTDITEHTEDSGMVTKEPTETESGVKTFHCTVCGYEIRTETISALSHPHVYSSDWKTDAKNHWHECACGDKTDITEHTEDSGTVTKEPTETESGVKTFRCTVCGYEIRTETIPALSHTHVYSSDWKTDAENHWHECACGDKTDITEHTEDSGTVTKEPTETESGVKTFRCTVCGYEIRTETIPALSHTHVYSSDWKTNAENHWHECACGERLNYSEHVFDSGTVTRYPTNTKAGEIEYRCNICGYVMQTEIIIPENPKTGEEEQPWKIMFFCSLVTIVCSLFLKNRKNKIV